MMNSNTGTSYGKYLLILMIFAVILFLELLGNRNLWKPDEVRVGGIGAEMYYSGDYTLPLLNGTPFLEKPPFFIWADATMYSVFGVNSFSARLPSALAAIGGILIIFLLAKRMGYSPLTAYLAGLFLATSGLYWQLARRCIDDMCMTFFVLGAMFCIYNLHIAFSSREKSIRNVFWFIGYILFLAGALLDKGLLGWGLAGVAVGTWLIIGLIKWKRIVWKSWLALIIGSLLAFIPLFLWLWVLGNRHGWNMVEVEMIKNNLGRFSGAYEQHSGPFYFYFRILPPLMLPWLVLVLAFIYFYYKKILKFTASNNFFYLLTWFVLPFIVLSIANSKRSIYGLPLFPAYALFLAICTGTIIERYEPFKKFNWKRISIIVTILVLIGYMVGDYVQTRADQYKKSYKPIFMYCKSLEAHGKTIELYQTGDENLMGGGPFYLGHTLKTINTIEELDKTLKNKNVAVIVSDPGVLKKAANAVLEKTISLRHDYFYILKGKN